MSIPPIAPVQASTSSTHAPLRQPARLPDAPTPVTPAVAAVHIMKLPASRLVEGFASLQVAIEQQARVQAAHEPLEEYAAVEATRPAPLDAARPAAPAQAEPTTQAAAPARIDLRA